MMDELLEANRAYVAGFGLRGIASRAAKGFALVTCMDSRIEPLAMLGLRAGDAKILRNAGARVTPDVLRSLVLATATLGVRAVAVMQHTDCALGGRSEADVRGALAERGIDAGEWQFLAMDDPDSALAADVQAVRGCELLPAGLEVEGWRYDVDTGQVARVIPA